MPDTSNVNTALNRRPPSFNCSHNVCIAVFTTLIDVFHIENMYCIPARTGKLSLYSSINQSRILAMPFTTPSSPSANSTLALAFKLVNVPVPVPSRSLHAVESRWLASSNFCCTSAVSPAPSTNLSMLPSTFPSMVM